MRRGRPGRRGGLRATGTRASRLAAAGASSDAALADLAAEAAEVEAVGPFLGAHRLQRTGRFVPIIGVALLLVVADPDLPPAGRAGIALVVLVGLALVVLIPWQRVPRDAQGYALLVPVLLVLVLMGADSGLRSPYSWLEFLPLLWLVLYERLRILVAALALVAAGFGLMFASNPEATKLPDFLPVLIFCLTFPKFHQVACDARRSMLAQSDRADHDPLTGLLNRRGLAQVGETFDQSSDLGIAAIYVDVNRFKSLNDRLGHAAGDDLLKQVGARLTASVRTADLVARMGGDEFVVIAEGDPATVQRIRDRIDSSVNTEPYQIGEAVIAMSLSVGVCSADRSHDLAALIEEADRAMREVKASHHHALRHSHG